MLAGGSDAAGEHEVEELGLADLVTRVGIHDRMLPAELAELRSRVVI